MKGRVTASESREGEIEREREVREQREREIRDRAIEKVMRKI